MCPYLLLSLIIFVLFFCWQDNLLRIIRNWAHLPTKECLHSLFIWAGEIETHDSQKICISILRGWHDLDFKSSTEAPYGSFVSFEAQWGYSLKSWLFLVVHRRNSVLPVMARMYLITEVFTYLHDVIIHSF